MEGGREGKREGESEHIHIISYMHIYNEAVPSWACLSCCQMARGRRTMESAEGRLWRTACLSDVDSELS